MEYRYRPRFFDQVGHQTMCAYIGNKHFFTKSRHFETYQNYEQFPQRLQRIYAMGGNFHGIGNASISGEFNFLCDPEAAYVVLRHTPQPIVLVPWEICEEIEFSLVKKVR